MGVFDFMYKSKPKPDRIESRHYRNRSNTPSTQYKRRTELYVAHRSNSLPEDDPQPKQYVRNRGAVRAQNSRQDQSHNHNVNVVDYYNKSKGKQDDDFTRLSRLEVMINNYLKRYNELDDEMCNIKLNLNLIFKEFKDEFKDLVEKQSNSHIINIGERILQKLDPFKGPKEKIEEKKNENDRRNSAEENRSKNSHSNHRDYDSQQKYPDENKNPFNQNPFENQSKQSDHKKANHNNRDNQINHSKYENDTVDFNQTNRTNYRHQNQTNYESQLNRTEYNEQTNPIKTDKHADRHKKSEKSKSINKSKEFSANETEIGDYSQYQDVGTPAGGFVKAKYAIVNSTPYQNDTIVSEHYKSTPILFQGQETPPTYGHHQMRYGQEDLHSTTIHQSNTDGTQSRMYLNMSMTMHSDHPAIEHCFRRIELLRPRIMNYKSEHKLRVYKELDKEIVYLMNRLNTVEVDKGSTLEHDKNVALCELHNLAGILERSIDCQDPNCVICNSFIYKPEISV